MALADKYNLFVVEDAAQAIDSYYIGKDGVKRPLGGIGHFAAFSFHETKNIISGEGGMLVVNDERFVKRAEIIWEKGTNRSAFFKGEVDKYGWVDVGSSFLPSEIISAFLWAQLENLNDIQAKRSILWASYLEGLKSWANEQGILLPNVPNFATNNAHMFYLICKNGEQRTSLINYLKDNEIQAVFHYLSLHKSPHYLSNSDEVELLQTDFLSETLVRLPLYVNLDVDKVIQQIIQFQS